MANAFHITSRICASPPKEPSSLGSDLGSENSNSVSLEGSITLSDEPTVQVGNPGSELKKKIIVVGAGIAGLRCASVLQRHGMDVVVLEGRDRIGGRIHTTRTSKGVRDIGAAWMHETSQNKLVKLINKLGIEYYYDDGMAATYLEHGRAGAQFKAKKTADEFADHCAWFYENHPDAPDVSVADFARQFVRDHELITDDDRAWGPQALKEVELWIGISTELASSKNLSYFITERNLYMKGGYDGIVGWVSDSLADKSVHLSSVVEDIEWTDHGSTACNVTYRDNHGVIHSMSADAIVCTVPLGVLHRNLISFNPPLPDDLRRGLSSVSYGALGKVFFEFADVFWSKENDQFIYYPSPPVMTGDDVSSSSFGSISSALDSDNILNYCTVTINLWIMSNSKQLCVQIAEPLTQRIEAMEDEKALYKFFEPLFKVLRTEPYKALPKLLSVESTHWTQDPLAGYGSYSADKVGDEAELWMEALNNHKGSRLQFAGEHCTLTGNGCVHGAFATGERAATNLLEVFDVTYDGGDLVSLTV